jgi:hypothetical protein
VDLFLPEDIIVSKQFLFIVKYVADSKAHISARRLGAHTGQWSLPDSTADHVG